MMKKKEEEEEMMKKKKNKTKNNKKKNKKKKKKKIHSLPSRGSTPLCQSVLPHCSLPWRLAALRSLCFFFFFFFPCVFCFSPCPSLDDIFRTLATSESERCQVCRPGVDGA